MDGDVIDSVRLVKGPEYLPMTQTSGYEDRRSITLVVVRYVEPVCLSARLQNVRLKAIKSWKGQYNSGCCHRHCNLIYCARTLEISDCGFVRIDIGIRENNKQVMKSTNVYPCALCPLPAHEVYSKDQSRPRKLSDMQTLRLEVTHQKVFMCFKQCKR